MLRRGVCRGAQDKHSRVHGSNSYRESDHHPATVIRVDLSWTAFFCAKKLPLPLLCVSVCREHQYRVVFVIVALLLQSGVASITKSAKIQIYTK